MQLLWGEVYRNLPRVKDNLVFDIVLDSGKPAHEYQIDFDAFLV